MTKPQTSSALTMIWEWPLRVWHWLFALCIAGSLTTGLMGDIALMDWHLRLGYCACALLLFRLMWGFVGGRYSRWKYYLPRPGRVLAHFRGDVERGAHTAPGVALAGLLLLAVALQALSGLFTTDDIFIEGPLVRHADDATVATMTALHHRAFYLVLAAIAIHLTAHVIYALGGSRTPLAMFTGRKAVAADVAASQSRGVWGIVTGILAAALVVGGLELLT
jgi:cytochrome b